MKIHVEIDLTPQEARELFGMSAMDNAQRFFFDALQNQASQETHPLFDLYQTFLNQSREAVEKYTKSMETVGSNKSEK
ncbi:hypothetical protein [Sessilibacter corallicola]|uniref:Uncharacterized protein n=1 Tax=Sessilibacter corallicola TaxID=2904075 RepID=A0ABQ0A7P6_9GAMM|nr:hypothetical protein [Sessilibacter corallicola]MCE2028846.1 hypothetical protein [Sessilibacter corallicola]